MAEYTNWYGKPVSLERVHMVHIDCKNYPIKYKLNVQEQLIIINYFNKICPIGFIVCVLYLQERPCLLLPLSLPEMFPAAFNTLQRPLQQVLQVCRERAIAGGRGLQEGLPLIDFSSKWPNIQVENHSGEYCFLCTGTTWDSNSSLNLRLNEYREK